MKTQAMYGRGMETDTESSCYWRQRALAAEVEVKDLTEEVQRLQDIVVSLTDRVAGQSELLSRNAEKRSNKQVA